MTLLIGLAFAGLVLATDPATLAAQQPAAAQAPPTYESVIQRTWKALHDKILTMAKDVPEDKLTWKPHPESRSIADEFRHVTIGLEMSAAELKGEKFDYSGRVKADQGKPATRASIVSEMERAIAASYPLVESSPKPRLVWWLDHQGEHYGKLVSNYRVNGLVPPVSRPRTASGGQD